MTTPSEGGPYGTNYCLYEWTENGWEPIENNCEYGYHCVPPDVPGEHVGQIIPTACEAD